MSRSRPVALGLVAVGAATALVAAGQTWVTGHGGGDGTPVVVVTGSGRDAAPAVGPLALLALAGVVALLASRGVLRAVVAALVTASGVGIVAAAVAGRGSVPDVPSLGGTVTVSGSAWPWVAVAGGLLVTAGGAVALARGRGWAAMSSRYQAPAAGAAPASTHEMWDALDRGEDPTASRPSDLPE